MKLWGSRFNKAADSLTHNFTSSIQFDQCLWSHDIMGSIAHVKMLGKRKLLADRDVNKIINGLKTIFHKIEEEKIIFNEEDEDIHSAIERYLYSEIGEAAGNLHIGRSRNDQVVVDLRLYLRAEIVQVIEKIMYLQNVLCELASQHINTVLPGYSHLQHALPISFAHHLLAYVTMLQRDVERFIGSWPRINVSPLGAGALAGTGFNTNPHDVAELLQFEGVCSNSIDAVSDRDFVVEFLANASLLMTHLSRLSEELILWSSHEFSFIELDDAYCTGSSMMPQKKNPDVAELTRGKSGRIFGSLMAMLTVLKGLPLAYNRDLQEDKEYLFDCVKTIKKILTLYAPMLATMKINKAQMEVALSGDFSTATLLANFLVSKSIPFREAHHVVGKVVAYCITQGKTLLNLTIAEYQKFSPLFDDTVYYIVDPKNSLHFYNAFSGTGKEAVLQQLQSIKQRIAHTVEWSHKMSKTQLVPAISSKR